jgi:hypothetical protein
MPRTGGRPNLSHDLFSVAEHDHGVGPLVRIDPDDDPVHDAPLVEKGAAADRPDAGDTLFTPLSSQAAAAPERRQIPLTPVRASGRQEDPESTSRGPRR